SRARGGTLPLGLPPRHPARPGPRRAARRDPAGLHDDALLRTISGRLRGDPGGDPRLSRPSTRVAHAGLGHERARYRASRIVGGHADELAWGSRPAFGRAPRSAAPTRTGPP